MLDEMLKVVLYVFYNLYGLPITCLPLSVTILRDAR